MSGAAAVSGGRAVGVTGSGHMVRGEALPANLLPPPSSTVGAGELQDATLALFSAQSKQGQQDMKAGESQAKRQREATAEAQRKVEQALAEMREAQREASGFWGKLKSIAGTIAKVAAVVSAVAATAFSGGMAAPALCAVAALVLSTGATIVRETRLFGDLSDKIAMGMEITGAAVGVVGGCIGGFTSIGSAANTAATTASNAAKVAKVVSTTAELVGGTATAAQGTATVVVAKYQRDADYAEADAEEARGEVQKHQRELALVTEWLKRTQEALQDAFETTAGAVQGLNQAMDVAIAGVRG